MLDAVSNFYNQKLWSLIQNPILNIFYYNNFIGLTLPIWDNADKRAKFFQGKCALQNKQNVISWRESMIWLASAIWLLSDWLK